MPHLCSHTADTGEDPYLREKSESRFMWSSVGWTTSVRKLNSTDVTKTWYKELGHLPAKTCSELHLKWALFFWSKTYFSRCFQHYVCTVKYMQLRDGLPFCKKHRHHITQIVFPSCFTPFCLLIIICTCAPYMFLIHVQKQPCPIMQQYSKPFIKWDKIFLCDTLISL